MANAMRWVSVPSARPGYARLRLRDSLPASSSLDFGWRYLAGSGAPWSAAFVRREP